MSSGIVTSLAGQAGTTGFANGVGTVARFKNPHGVAMDAAGIFVVVVGVKMKLIGALKSFAFALTGSPLALLWMQGDLENHLIRRIDTSSGAVITLAGQAGISGVSDGVGTAATFNWPGGVAMDAAGSVVIVVRGGSGR